MEIHTNIRSRYITLLHTQSGKKTTTLQKNYNKIFTINHIQYKITYSKWDVSISVYFAARKKTKRNLIILTIRATECNLSVAVASCRGLSRPVPTCCPAQQHDNVVGNNGLFMGIGYVMWLLEGNMNNNGKYFLLGMCILCFITGKGLEPPPRYTNACKLKCSGQ